MAENEPKAAPHWLVRLFFGLTFAGLAAVVTTYLLPTLPGADGGQSGGATRTAAVAVTVVGLAGVLVCSALLKKRAAGDGAASEQPRNPPPTAAP